MARKIDGIRAVVALGALRRADASIQRAVLSDELAATWRAAAHRKPESAVDWWKSNTAMGSRLRKLIPLKEVARLFHTLPLKTAAQRIRCSEDRLEEVAAQTLPRARVLAMWKEVFDGPYEALEAWGGEDPLGDALRRHVGPDPLTEAWQAVGLESWGDALNLWQDPLWFARGLHNYVDAETFRRLWSLVAEDDPYYAARLLDITLEDKLAHIQPLDLSPLATSNEGPVREAALRYLEKMIGRGFSEPEDPGAFVEEWRTIASTNCQWAAKLMMAVPASVRAKLTHDDIATLLECPDSETRLRVITALKEQGDLQNQLELE